MNISIAERYRPFSHQFETMAMLPKSYLGFQIFPAMLRVFDLSGPFRKQIDERNINIHAPVKGFTVLQDLEKGHLKVWGEGSKGYFRYRIQALQDGHSFVIIPEREPNEFPIFTQSAQTVEEVNNDHSPIERLSFGITKSQDWTLVNRRLKMMEILPFWHKLGQMLPVPQITNLESMGTLYLLKMALSQLENKESDELIKTLELLYLASFEGLFIPKLEDDRSHGLNLPPIDKEELTTPLALLSEGKNLIKRMLVDQNDTEIAILPCLPSKFHCGRMVNVTLQNNAMIDMEWSKKKIRRICLKPLFSGYLQFKFPSNVKTFRLRRKSDRSTQIKTCGAAIEFSSTDTYFFDNFCA